MYRKKIIHGFVSTLAEIYLLETNLGGSNMPVSIKQQQESYTSLNLLFTLKSVNLFMTIVEPSKLSDDNGGEELIPPNNNI